MSRVAKGLSYSYRGHHSEAILLGARLPRRPTTPGCIGPPDPAGGSRICENADSEGKGVWESSCG
jgi:hypothetical protein